MVEPLANLYMSLAQLFADLFPKRFHEAARSGPIWRRILVALFIAFGSLVVGMVAAAIVVAAGFLVIVVVIGIFRAF